VGSVAGGALDESMQFREVTVDVRAGRSTLEVRFAPLLLGPGDYSVELHLFDATGHSGFTSTQQYYFKPRLVEFGVRRLGNPNRSIVYYQPAAMELR